MSTTNHEVIDDLRTVKRCLKKHPRLPHPITVKIGDERPPVIELFAASFGNHFDGAFTAAIEETTAEVGAQGWVVNETCVEKFVDGVTIRIYIPAQRSVSLGATLMRLGWLAATEAVL